MSHITLHMPTPVEMPRAAPIAASLFLAAMATLDRARRARAEMQRQLSLGREAAALRRYATQVAKDSPGLAADLFSAADRHFPQE